MDREALQHTLHTPDVMVIDPKSGQAQVLPAFAGAAASKHQASGPADWPFPQDPMRGDCVSWANREWCFRSSVCGLDVYEETAGSRGSSSSSGQHRDAVEEVSLQVTKKKARSSRKAKPSAATEPSAPACDMLSSSVQPDADLLDAIHEYFNEFQVHEQALPMAFHGELWRSPMVCVPKTPAHLETLLMWLVAEPQEDDPYRGDIGRSWRSGLKSMKSANAVKNSLRRAAASAESGASSVAEEGPPPCQKKPKGASRGKQRGARGSGRSEEDEDTLEHESQDEDEEDDDDAMEEEEDSRSVASLQSVTSATTQGSSGSITGHGRGRAAASRHRKRSGSVASLTTDGDSEMSDGGSVDDRSLFSVNSREDDLSDEDMEEDDGEEDDMEEDDDMAASDDGDSDAGSEEDTEAAAPKSRRR
jgi:hypothetical protein